MTTSLHTSPACLKTHELELLAENTAPPAIASQRHLDHCSRCRASLERIRRENAFMTDHAEDLRSAVLSPSKAPDSLPGYTILRRLSSGGQGIVYEALQTTTSRRVAVKMLREGAFASDRQRYRFEREVGVLASLRHPNIVTVFDKGKASDGLDFVVMEFVDGRPINEYCRELRTKPHEHARTCTRECLALLAKAATAVQHAHSLGVMHRDLKPGNILVDQHGEPRVIDFGLARYETGDRGPMPTRTREFMGTSAYASPEQFTGNPEFLTVATDVYSLGVVMFEALTGAFPYPVDGTPMEVERHARTTEPKRPSQLNHAVADDVDTIVLKALSKDPLRRYVAAGELAADIEAFLAGRPIAARPDSVVYRWKKLILRNRLLTSASLVILVTLAMWVTSIVLKNQELTREQARTSRAVTDSNMRQARLLTSAGNTIEAEGLLWPELFNSRGNPHDPGLGFTSPPEVMRPAWALFEAFSRSPRLLATQANGDFTPASFQSGGTSLVGPNLDGSAEQWRLTGERIEVSSPLPTPMRSTLGERVWIAPDKTFAILAEQKELVLIDCRSGERIAVSSFTTDRIQSLVISPDGARFVTLDDSGSVLVWNMHTLEILNERARDADPNATACFSPDSELMAIRSRAGSLKVWNLETSGQPLVFASPISSAQSVQSGSPVISPDRHWIACPRGASISLWPIDDPSCWFELAGHQSDVIECRFSSDSKRLLSTSLDRTVRVWDTASSVQIAVLGPVSGLKSLATFNDEGTLVAVRGSDSQLSLWESFPNSWSTVIATGSADIQRVNVSRNGALAVSADAGGRVLLWDVQSKRELSRTQSESALCTGAAISGSPTLIVYRSSEGAGSLMQWDGLTKPKGLASSLGEGVSVELSPDETTVAFTDHEKVCLYDLKSCERRVIGQHAARITQLAFDPVGGRLVSASEDGACIVHELASGNQIKLQGHQSAIRTVCFSPDSNTVATGGDDLTIRLWDVRSAREIRTIRASPASIRALCFHPAGRLLFSACNTPDVTVWDPATGTELATIRGEKDGILTLAITPDGRTLLVGSRNGKVGFVDLKHYQRHIRGNAPRVSAAANGKK